MKATKLVHRLLQLPAGRCACPLTGTECDAPHLRAALDIRTCEDQSRCPIGKHRKIIPLMQAHEAELRRIDWQKRRAA